MKHISLFLFLLVLFYGCESSITNADIEGSKSTIQYSLAEKSDVKLILKNTHNIIIAFLVNDVQEAGNYEIELDTTNLPEGLYTLTLIAKSLEGNFFFQDTKALLVIRR